MPEIEFTLVGGPTTVFALGGLTFMTDPTFDGPGSYPSPGGTDLVKTRGPALAPSDLPHPDVVLLSHDHHPDNLDHSGRELLPGVASVFTTTAAAERLGNGVVGLGDYESAELPLPGGGKLTITAVPAHHGPDGVWQKTGPVIGFVITGEDVPTVYLSGDNSSLEVVREITEKFHKIDLAVLFAGAVQLQEDGPFLTLTNDDLLEAAKILAGATIIPVHADSWAHFTQSTTGLKDAFQRAGIGQRIVVLEPGSSSKISV